MFLNEAKHIYLLDGQQLPCVSDLCRFLHRELYKDAPVWKVEEAAVRGTAIHAAAQALDTTGSAAIPGEYLPYLSAYKAFLRDHRVSWSMVEQPMYHPELMYAGTIDRYGQVDNASALVDIKSTYTVHKALCRAQLNLYRLMLLAKGLPVDKMFILHLKRDGTYRLIRFDTDLPLVEALLTLHNALPKRRRKGVSNV